MNQEKQYKKAVHVFRRDLRLEDNTALLAALEQSETVIPCFILDPRQIEKHKYRGLPALQFMKESLQDLQEQLAKKGAKVYIAKGKAETLITKLIKKEKVDAVFFNEDYTPFSKKRDTAIQQQCEKANIACHTFHDELLTIPGEILTQQGKPYTKFTPFFNTAKKKKVAKPRKNTYKNFYTKKIANTTHNIAELLPKQESSYKGGRTEALKILKHLKKYKHYDTERNEPAKEGTTKLSPHHKFGTISIRETYHAIAEQLGSWHTLITELYWRDFFTHIAFFFPHVFSGCFYKKYDKLKWENDTKKFKAWCKGKTGFPIVDAGMRELNETGFMHNRVRMIVASFLIKDLHVDWRWGEQYFAQQLVDYDPSVNNGNWQWSASTGCDAAPYFRIFNPWLQQKKYDLFADYIKKWVPELKALSAKEIHNLEVHPIEKIRYPKPIIDHKKESEKIKKMYASIS